MGLREQLETAKAVADKIESYADAVDAITEALSDAVEAYGNKVAAALTEFAEGMREAAEEYEDKHAPVYNVNVTNTSGSNVDWSKFTDNVKTFGDIKRGQDGEQF